MGNKLFKCFGPESFLQDPYKFFKNHLDLVPGRNRELDKVLKIHFQFRIAEVVTTDFCSKKVVSGSAILDSIDTSAIWIPKTGSNNPVKCKSCPFNILTGSASLTRIRIPLFTLIRIWNRIRIRILLYIRVTQICDHWSTDPSRLHLDHPCIYCERPPGLLGSILSIKNSWILTLMRTRSQIFALMRIRIRLPQIFRIRIRSPDFNPDQYTR